MTTASTDFRHAFETRALASGQRFYYFAQDLRLCISELARTLWLQCKKASEQARIYISQEAILAEGLPAPQKKRILKPPSED